MHPSIPAAVRAASPYHDVFQYQDNSMLPVLNLLPALIVAAIMIPPVASFSINSIRGRGFSLGKLITALVTAVLFTGMACGALLLVSYTTLGDVQRSTRDAMAQNVRIQYHAVLKPEPNSAAWEVNGALTNLDQPKQYTLYFPNGKSWVYTMRFDKGTSKPVIISPTPPVDPASQKELDAAAKQIEANTYQSLSPYSGIDTNKSSTDSSQQALDRTINANLQKKYGLIMVSHQCPQAVTQGSRGGTYMSTMDFYTCFTQATSYELQKDGKTGTYAVSWNIETGEPYASVTTTVPVTPINQPSAG